MFVIANVHDDKKIKKEYDFLDKNKDFVAVNMNKGITRNNNDSTITGNYTLINKIKMIILVKMLKSCYVMKNMINVSWIIANIITQKQ